MIIRSLAAFMLIAFTSIASAQYVGPRAAVINTVAAAKQAADDTPVVLEGYIVRQINNDDLYEFKDDTGSVTVDISRKKWPAQVSAKDKVRLFGEVDRGITNLEIEVDRVELINRQ